MCCPCRLVVVFIVYTEDFFLRVVFCCAVSCWLCIGRLCFGTTSTVRRHSSTYCCATTCTTTCMIRCSKALSGHTCSHGTEAMPPCSSDVLPTKVLSGTIRQMVCNKHVLAQEDFLNSFGVNSILVNWIGCVPPVKLLYSSRWPQGCHGFLGQHPF